MNWEDQKKLSDAAFKELSGVKRETFERMLSILEKEYRGSHKNGGRPPKLSACDWGVAKSTVCDSIKWVEDTLAKGQNLQAARQEDS
jgi:hypothetical protein